MIPDGNKGPEVDLDVLIEDSRWETIGVEQIATRAVKETISVLRVESDVIELALLACDDARIAVLNSTFRDKITSTNVLSWPAEDLAAATEGGDPHQPEVGFDGTTMLGDVAIAYETCAKEAFDLGKPISDHVTHLVVHGVLHLLGYDHIRDPDAALMQSIETKILGKMGLDDPYRTE